MKPEESKIYDEIQNEIDYQENNKEYAFSNQKNIDSLELIHAAVCYALTNVETGVPMSPWYWPWDWFKYKPSLNKRENLIKAAALLIKEIKRLGDKK
jgi:hypothetical protein